MTAFQRLVQGSDSESGNVVGCIIALAAAAGNEQLWKPLNHEVLQACGNDHRSEVRKAGVTCLLSLIKTLGEEYMVLLPECLPVISELLEDNDEETAGLAQMCVSISEDLLGESLADSLR
jgi:U3 small nucleolar RNA-associated protein 10